MRSRVIMIWLNRPIASPVSKPAPAASQIGRVLGHKALATTPVEAATEPTERSTPPVISTMVIPIAEIPTTARVLAIVTTLLALKKVGARTPKMAHITTNAAKSTAIGLIFRADSRPGRETVSCIIMFCKILNILSVYPHLPTFYVASADIFLRFSCIGGSSTTLQCTGLDQSGRR